ncbi:nucleotide exchange factor GrpE, partial [Sporofaciens musculi]|uniref:nucleotide exchange factor GrpE n=1 Tax=Sporofaciens musculi TaxID=2681861 RepID=UPI002570DAC0
MEKQKEKSQEDMVKEAVEEAKKAAEEAKDSEAEPKDGCEEHGPKKDEAQEGCEDEAEASEDDGDTEAGENDQKSGKKFFGKKNKKDKKDEKIDELTDRLTRQMAEFDNFRKRTDKEKSQMYEIGAKDIIDKILPVVDNFERGLGAVKGEEKEDPFIQGMEKVYKQLMTMLESAGVKPIEAVGQEFNPDFHNAVMH